jgi:hypothetical protein
MRIAHGLALVVGIAACKERRLLVMRGEGPPQRTLTALRTMYKEAIEPCRLPAVSAPAAGFALTSLDSGLRVMVPGTWPAVSAMDSMSEEPDAKWTDDRRRTIEIAREYNGLSGPRYFVTSNPIRVLPTCAVAEGDAGAIWRRYDPAPPDPSKTPLRYLGFGEVITRDSVRYRITVSAMTARARDSLASWVSLAAITPR